MKFRLRGICAIAIFAAGCSISLSGSASLSADGRGVVLKGDGPIEVRAAQPKLPPPPPPPPKPVVVGKARVVGKKIEILDKVMFDFNKATIKEESFGLLQDVGTILRDHPEIEKLRIEGHTDSEGSDRFNKKLSAKRAAAVRENLIGQGVAEERLVAVGYGEERPIARNDQDEGREENRRVEFNILVRTAPGAVKPKIVRPVMTPAAGGGDASAEQSAAGDAVTPNEENPTGKEAE